jgi:peptide/nickel transport system ATP-binding protein
VIEVTARGLGVWIGANEVVRALDLELRAGAAVGVVGPSGAGKSALLRGLVGLERTVGSLWCDGVELVDAPASAWRGLRRRVQLCWQAGALDPNLTVAEILDEARVLAALPRWKLGDASLKIALERVALAVDVLRRRPTALSGGQRQRVALARALAAEPGVLLADEITSGVDRPVAWGLVELLKELVRGGLGLVFVTHDLSLLPGLVEQVVVLADGAVVERGATTSVLASPQHAVTRALRAAVPRLAV